MQQTLMSIFHDRTQAIREALSCGLTLPRAECGSYLLRVIEGIGDHCTDHDARQIAALACRLTAERPASAAELLTASAALHMAAGMWLRAYLLQANGRHLEAGDAFQNVHPCDPDAAALGLVRAGHNYVTARAWQHAARCLSRLADVRCSYWTVCEAARLVDKVQQEGGILRRKECRLAILGPSTVTSWVPALKIAAFAADIALSVSVWPLDEYKRDLLDASSQLVLFQPNIVLIAIDWVTPQRERSDSKPAYADGILKEITDLWLISRERFCASIIQHNFEVPVDDGRRGADSPTGHDRQLITFVNQELACRADEEPSISIFDIDEAASIYGKAEWNDESVVGQAVRQYPALNAIPDLARRHVAHLKAVLGPSVTCVAFELDGIVWGGDIRCDGIGRLRMGASAAGQPFRKMQQYLQMLHRRGIRLAVCSRNDEAEGKLPFELHPEMLLQLSDIAVFVANREPRSQNLQHIARTLSIPLDTLVFLDPDPVERALVRSELPAVQVIDLAEPSSYVKTIEAALGIEPMVSHIANRNGRMWSGPRARAAAVQSNQS